MAAAPPLPPSGSARPNVIDRAVDCVPLRFACGKGDFGSRDATSVTGCIGPVRVGPKRRRVGLADARASGEVLRGQCRSALPTSALTSPSNLRLLRASASLVPLAGTSSTVTTTVSSRLPLGSRKLICTA